MRLVNSLQVLCVYSSPLKHLHKRYSFIMFTRSFTKYCNDPTVSIYINLIKSESVLIFAFPLVQDMSVTKYLLQHPTIFLLK